MRVVEGTDPSTGCRLFSTFFAGWHLRLTSAMLLLAVTAGCSISGSKSPRDASQCGGWIEPEHNSAPATVSEWISQPRPEFLSDGTEGPD